MFNKNIYTLGAFIDQSNASDTVNHKIFLKKRSHCGKKIKAWIGLLVIFLTGNNLKVTNVNSKSALLDIVCGMLQGFILGPLLFLLHINDLTQASKLLVPIIFADDINLFYSGNDIHSLFHTANNELSNSSHWLNSNKFNNSKCC